ncbi:MAG: DUF1002 domain-containing protein [Patescibacteria group bacterium]
MRKLPAVVMAIAFCASALGAPWQRVISYGADLTPEERVSVVRDFGLPPEVDPGQIPTITVTHGEEAALLQRVAPPEAIGTRAVSSVYIERVAAGGGLSVSTRNITWVSPAMYANAMATGGVRDAKVIVTAPSPVSGTAALTGIFKAFSHLTGRTLPAPAEEAAAEELVGTGELGQNLGRERAASYMAAVKEELVESRVTTAAEIRSIVERVANEQKMNLTAEQLNRVTDIMVRISKLGLDLGDLRAQLKNFTQTRAKPAAGLSGLIAQVIAFFQSLFKQLVGFVGRFVRFS